MITAAVIFLAIVLIIACLLFGIIIGICLEDARYIEFEEGEPNPNEEPYEKGISPY